MKKNTLILLLVMVTMTAMTSAQQKNGKTEVLFFKANLCACKAKACSALETTVQDIIERNYKDCTVTFREVKLSDTTNNQLISKYKAQSQTLIIVNTKKKKETSVDLSAQLKEYATTKDTIKFERELTAEINELIE